MAKFSEGGSAALAVVLPLVKTCPHCRVSKPIVQFYKSANSMDGADSWCKECQRERRKVRYRQEQNDRYGVEDAERRRKRLIQKRSATPGCKVCCKCWEEKPTSRKFIWWCNRIAHHNGEVSHG